MPSGSSGMLAGLDLSFSLVSIFDPHCNSWAVPALDLSRNSAGLVLQGEENGDDDSFLCFKQWPS